MWLQERGGRARRGCGARDGVVAVGAGKRVNNGNEEKVKIESSGIGPWFGFEMKLSGRHQTDQRRGGWGISSAQSVGARSREAAGSHPIRGDGWWWGGGPYLVSLSPFLTRYNWT